MSEIYMRYADLEDSINRSQKVRIHISEYAQELKKRIVTPISQLPGSDTSGYTSTASYLALEKINALNNKANQFVSYETSVRNLISVAKNRDNYVARQMETITGLHLPERNWYQKVGDYIYNTFCVDLSNNWAWIRGVSDFAKKIRTKVEHFHEIAVDWFKYGDGKYVLNLIVAGGKMIAAAAATAAAIAAIPFTGGSSAAIAVGCVAAVASMISTGITMYNMEAKIRANSKALSLSGDIFKDDDGDIGAARYYGNISSVSEEWARTDMGDAETNARYEFYGKVIDTTKVVADTTVVVCNITNSAFAVRDYRYTKNIDKQIKGYEFSWKNFKHNVRGELGLYITKPGIKIKNTEKLHDTYEAIKGNIEYFEKQRKTTVNIWTTTNSSRIYTESFDVEETIKSVYKDYSNVKNLYKSIEKIEKTDKELQKLLKTAI